MTHPPPVLEVQGLSKRYPSHLPAAGTLLLPRWLRGRQQPESGTWALRDVSFDLGRGERLGIIGRNGAGKSTLLKVLSRVTPPTSGRALIRGRVASLLEVGTGFNDSLSGRENVYLNAALHGLGRAEVEQRYPAIVAFAELDDFIDAPVRTYSSGMRMRLAFSVAAHLDPDILMLDEVLAVGDMSFQKKCLSRMNDLTGEGRTLLFVSHGMDAVARFCTRCLWLDAGRVRADGPVEQVISAYLERIVGVRPSLTAAAERTCNPADDHRTAPPFGSEELESAAVRLIGARVLSADDEVAATIRVDQPCRIEIDYEILEPARVIEPALHIRTADHELAFVVAYTDSARPDSNRAPGRYRVAAEIPPNLLNVGIYHVTVALVTPDPLQRHLTVENAIAFNVHEPDHATSTARGRYGRAFPGPVRPLLSWRTSFVGDRPADTASRSVEQARPRPIPAGS